MALRDEQKDHLRKAGLTDEQITGLETDLAGKAQAAQAAGIESKEADPPAETLAPAAETPDFATRQEIADAMVAVSKPIMEALNGVTAQLAAMQAEVKAMKETDEIKIAKAAEATPRASLESLIAQSIIGNKDAQIDGRTALAKAGPKQAEANTPLTPVPFIDSLIRQSQGGLQ